MKTKCKIILLMLFAGLCVNIQAQKDSLASYMEIAAKNNPVVMQKYYDYQAALRRVPQARAWPDPQLNAGVFLQPMEIMAGKQYANIQLMQMFPWFGTLRAANDEMSLMANVKYEMLEDAKFKLFLQMNKTWYELYKIDQALKYTNENLDLLKTIENLALVRFKAPLQNVQSSSKMSMGKMQTTSGSGLTDLYRINIERLDLEDKIASLQSKRKSVQAKFNSYLNREQDAVIVVPDNILPDLYALPDRTDSVFANNPMLMGSRFEEEALVARKKKITRMTYPKWGLGLQYTIVGKSNMSTSSMNGNDMIMPMFSMSLPIYGMKNYSMKKEVQYQQKAAKAASASVLNDLSVSYYEAEQQMDEAQRRMNLYSKQTDLTEKTLELMIKDFSTSSVALTDVLEVRRQLLMYKLIKSEALADYNTAIAKLRSIFPYR